MKVGKENIFGLLAAIKQYGSCLLYTSRANQSCKRVYAVCTTGSGSAELLLANLQNKFPDLNVLGTISIQKAIHLTRRQADAVISTTYFHNDAIPVIARCV